MLLRRPLILFLLAALLLTGCRPSPSPFTCTDAIRCVDIAPRAPVKIGVIQNLTGLGPSGLGMARCVELARDDREGQLLGHPIELVVADGKCSGEDGTTAALKIAADPQIEPLPTPRSGGLK